MDGHGQETHSHELYCAYARGADPRIVWYIDCCHTTVALRQRVAMKVDSGKFAFLSGWQVAALCLRERAECVTAALLNFQGQAEAPVRDPVSELYLVQTDSVVCDNPSQTDSV